MGEELQRLAALNPKPQRLSTEQIALLVATIGERAPHLVPVAERLGRGKSVNDHDIDQIEEVLAQEMAMEYSDAHGLTGRGIEMDDLIGVVRQHGESFF